MSARTIAVPTGSGNTVDNCASAGPNGTPVATFLEQAIAAHRATGVVTTTRVTHATPASTYAHICHRDLENAIASQVVPGGAPTAEPRGIQPSTRFDPPWLSARKLRRIDLSDLGD